MKLEELFGVSGHRRSLKFFLFLALACLTAIISLVMAIVGSGGFGSWQWPWGAITASVAVGFGCLSIGQLLCISIVNFFRLNAPIALTAIRLLVLPGLVVSTLGVIVSIVIMGGQSAGAWQVGPVLGPLPGIVGLSIYFILLLPVLFFHVVSLWLRHRLIRKGFQIMEQMRTNHRPVGLCRIEMMLSNETASPTPSPAWAPREFYLPGLKQMPWWDPAEFDWVPELEANANKILAEFDRLKEHQIRRYAYPGVGKDWCSFSFHANGHLAPDALSWCPITADLVKKIGGVKVRPAMFSVLGPHGKIEPHRDEGNLVLTCHLGLRIPASCGIRVGAETRHWQEGRCLILDPSFEHTAWNHNDDPRVVLLINFPHPELTCAEREFFEEYFEIAIHLSSLQKVRSQSNHVIN